jgi:hypothetical protein
MIKVNHFPLLLIVVLISTNTGCGVRDPYKTLGIEKGSSLDCVRQAYCRQIQEYYPKANQGDLDAAKMVEYLDWAFEEILKTKKYDYNFSIPDSGACRFNEDDYDDVSLLKMCRMLYKYGKWISPTGARKFLHYDPRTDAITRVNLSEEDWRRCIEGHLF